MAEYTDASVIFLGIPMDLEYLQQNEWQKFFGKTIGSGPLFS